MQARAFHAALLATTMDPCFHHVAAAALAVNVLRLDLLGGHIVLLHGLFALARIVFLRDLLGVLVLLLAWFCLLCCRSVWARSASWSSISL